MTNNGLVWLAPFFYFDGWLSVCIAVCIGSKMAASIMRTVGEGFMRPNYEEQPINVQHSKLLGTAFSPH